jgi:hypothetical protein
MKGDYMHAKSQRLWRGILWTSSLNPIRQRTAAVAEPSRSGFVLQRRSLKSKGSERGSKFVRAAGGLRHNRGPLQGPPTARRCRSAIRQREERFPA